MLSENEKEGARKLLNILSQTDCIALAKTVTLSQLAVHDKEGAVEIVVRYTETPAQLLKRKKVNKGLLFSYLANENIAVNPKSEKHVLIKKILDLWGSTPVPDDELMLIDEVPDVVPKAPSSLMALAAHRVQQAQPTAPDIIQSNHHATHAAPPHTDSQSDQELAKAFICWFYPLLNNVDQSSEFGTQHFFASSALRLAHGTIGGEVNFEEHQGSEAVVRRLAVVVLEGKVKFCPNIDEGRGGYAGLSTPVGLRKVKVCGTLHSGEELVGVFEQEFGLVRDPDSDFNFRIKYTNLKLMAGQPAQQPTLALTDGLMALPST